MYANTVFTPSSVNHESRGSNVDYTQYAPESVYEQQQQVQQEEEQPLQLEQHEQDD